MNKIIFNLFCINILFLNFSNLYCKNTELQFPYIPDEKCPFEGCQLGNWTTLDDLIVFTDDKYKIKANFKLSKGEKFSAIDSKVIIERPGIIEVVEPFRNFKVKDKILVICYHGEGTYTFAYKGNLIGGADIYVSKYNKKIKILQEWIMYWCIKVKNQNGKIGWIKLKNNTMQGFGTNEKIRGRDYLSGT